MNFIESAKRIRPTLIENFKPVEDEKYASILRRGAAIGMAIGLIVLEDSIKTTDVGKTMLSGFILATTTLEAAIHLKK